ncbi:helix-turn-helix domain-containing protein [Salana multivorans]
MVAFRNLEIDSSAPVNEWGVEGLASAIDRGGLAEWRRIAHAINADPAGEVALDLEEALEIAESPGVTASLRRILDEARLSEREQTAKEFSRMVRRTGLGRAELAMRLGTSRSRLSTYETGATTPSAVMWQRLRALQPAPPRY